MDQPYMDHAWLTTNWLVFKELLKLSERMIKILIEKYLSTPNLTKIKLV